MTNLTITAVCYADGDDDEFFSSVSKILDGYEYVYNLDEDEKASVLDGESTEYYASFEVAVIDAEVDNIKDAISALDANYTIE